MFFKYFAPNEYAILTGSKSSGASCVDHQFGYLDIFNSAIICKLSSSEFDGLAANALNKNFTFVHKKAYDFVTF